jgi:glycosyltransferase involved in cell wall biosynthesis
MTMRIAMLTPLPPTKSGVAHYASMVAPALGARAFDSLDGFHAHDYDHVIYQLGNNPHHELMYREAMHHPGVVVLHDLVLHHLIVEMTLARGDADAYVSILQANHGEAGAAWARGRAAGLHSEMGNFLMPASVEIAQRAKSVIVHNRYARERLLSFGVTAPIHVVPHPHVPETRQFDRDALRARHGFKPDDRVIGFFGFLTSAKRAEVVLEAFQRANDAKLKLLIVGEPAPNIDVEALRGEHIVLTGYVADEDFPSYYAVADRFVNLRYPSAGETSGTLIRAFDAGKPVAVSDYAQFAELPDDCVFKVPFDAEVERLIEFFTSDLASPAKAQRQWLEENATLEKCVAGYERALRDTARQPRNPQPATLPLFPQLTLIDTTHGITLRNDGTTTIQTRTYGTPEYRLIAQVFDGDKVVDDRWLALPGDLRPGQTVTIEYTPRANGTLALSHALQDVPIVAQSRVIPSAVEGSPAIGDGRSEGGRSLDSARDDTGEVTRVR